MEECASGGNIAIRIIASMATATTRIIAALPPWYLLEAIPKVPKISNDTVERNPRMKFVVILAGKVEEEAIESPALATISASHEATDSVGLEVGIEVGLAVGSELGSVNPGENPGVGVKVLVAVG